MRACSTQELPHFVSCDIQFIREDIGNNDWIIGWKGISRVKTGRKKVIQQVSLVHSRCCSDSAWISSNYLTANVEKSKCMLITRSRSHRLNLKIFLNGKQLERVKHFKYLGLWISDDLSWSYHIEAVCSKARRMLGFIYRFFSPHCDANTILSLYKAHVLPILDYASVVWDPHLKKDQQLLDSV